MHVQIVRRSDYHLQKSEEKCDQVASTMAQDSGARPRLSDASRMEGHSEEEQQSNGTRGRLQRVQK